MRFTKYLSAVALLVILQGCVEGIGDSGTDTDPSGSANPPVTSSSKPISDCTDGITLFYSGDKITKTITPTEIEMLYSEDGSQSGCVVSGAAEIESSAPNS